MRKYCFLFLFLMLLYAPLSAQEYTIWVGAAPGYDFLGGGWSGTGFPDCGFDYTNSINGAMNWSVGIGTSTKSEWGRVRFAQIEGNVDYRCLGLGRFRFSAFAGPFAGQIISAGIVCGNLFGGRTYGQNYFNKFTYGVQAGLKMDYRFISFKAGYEQGLRNFYHNPNNADNLIGKFFFRLGINLEGFKK